MLRGPTSFPRILVGSSHATPPTGNTSRTSLHVPQPTNNNRTHNHDNHLTTDPVPCEEYLQQWDIMAFGARKDDEGRMTGDGRERGR